MKGHHLLQFTILAMLVGSAPVAAQCMRFRVSVYSDGSVSDDLSTVYGYSNFADHSSTCGCTHSDYTSDLKILAPDGSFKRDGQPGTESSTSMATNWVGEYDVVGIADFDCSCAGGMETSDQPEPVNVKGLVQVQSVSMDTDPIYLSSAQPTCGTATVAVVVQGLNLTGITPPTVTVSVAGSTSTPPGASVSSTPVSPSGGTTVATSSPANFTFNVCAAGLPQGAGSASMTIQGAVLGAVPDSEWTIKDPSPGANALKAFMINR